MFKIKWKVEVDPEKYVKKAHKQLRVNFDQAGKMLANTMRAMVNVPFPPPSAPGEPPHTRSGTLLNSIVSLPVDKPIGAKVGSIGLGKGAYLEFGTSKMAARPFIWPALQAKKREIVVTIGSPITAIGGMTIK